MTDRSPIEIAAERMAYWRRRALNVDTDQEADLAEHFGLTPGQARILAKLYDAAGSVVKTWELALAARITDRSVSALIREMRDALECEAIDSTRGIPGGYWLTEVGMAEVGAVFGVQAKEEAA